MPITLLTTFLSFRFFFFSYNNSLIVIAIIFAMNRYQTYFPAKSYQSFLHSTQLHYFPFTLPNPNYYIIPFFLSTTLIQWNLINLINLFPFLTNKKENSIKLSAHLSTFINGIVHYTFYFIISRHPSSQFYSSLIIPF